MIDELVINLTEEFGQLNFWNLDSERVYSELKRRIDRSNERLITLNVKSLKGFDYNFIKNTFVKLLNC